MALLQSAYSVHTAAQPAPSPVPICAHSLAQNICQQTLAQCPDFQRRKVKALSTTLTLENAIAAPAIMGLR